MQGVTQLISWVSSVPYRPQQTKTYPSLGIKLSCLPCKESRLQNIVKGSLRCRKHNFFTEEVAPESRRLLYDRRDAMLAPSLVSFQHHINWYIATKLCSLLRLPSWQ